MFLFTHTCTHTLITFLIKNKNHRKLSFPYSKRSPFFWMCVSGGREMSMNRWGSHTVGVQYIHLLLSIKLQVKVMDKRT